MNTDKLSVWREYLVGGMVREFFFFAQIVVASGLLIINTAHAGQYELAQPNPAEGIVGAVSDPDACHAYLRNLKEFENLPYGMACRRELDPTFGFSRPKWEKLDVLGHIDLVIAIIQFAHLAETWLPKEPKLWEARIKEMVEKEGLSMDLTRVDVTGDGKLDNLVRFGFKLPCEPKSEINTNSAGKHQRLFVVNETLTKVDPYSQKGFFLSALDDVFLYKGKVYTDLFTPEPKALRKQRKRLGRLSLLYFSKEGPVEVCTFVYSAAEKRGGHQP